MQIQNTKNSLQMHSYSALKFCSSGNLWLPHYRKVLVTALLWCSLIGRLSMYCGKYGHCYSDVKHNYLSSCLWGVGGCNPRVWILVVPTPLCFYFLKKRSFHFVTECISRTLKIQPCLCIGFVRSFMTMSCSVFFFFLGGGALT